MPRNKKGWPECLELKYEIHKLDEKDIDLVRVVRKLGRVGSPVTRTYLQLRRYICRTLRGKK